MNYYGNSGYSHPQEQPSRPDYYAGSPAFPSAIPEHQQAQYAQPNVKLEQNQTNFHCRVRDMYFSAWQSQQGQQESVWQGHKNPKVYEGDEVHCFNSYCQSTFRNSQQLVMHILRGDCGEITIEEIPCLVRDWKALQIELGRCGKLTGDEMSCLERAWEVLQAEQAKSGKITRDLIGFLVLAWEILSGNRSMYTLTQPSASSSLMQESSMQETSMAEVDQTWRARFRYSTGNVKR